MLGFLLLACVSAASAKDFSAAGITDSKGRRLFSASFRRLPAMDKARVADMMSDPLPVHGNSLVVKNKADFLNLYDLIFTPNVKAALNKTVDGLFVAVTRASAIRKPHTEKKAHPGLHGGWISIVHHYPSDMAQNFWTAIWAFSVNFIITILVSLFGKPKPEAELVGLVHSLTPKPELGHLPWWRRPEALGVLLIVMVVTLNIIFR